MSMLETLTTIVWDVDPLLIKLGPLEFRYYGILFATALMAAYSILRWQFEEYGEDPEDAVRLTYVLVAGVVLGSRLGHVLFYEPERYWDACFHPLEAGLQTSDCLLWLKFWKGGLASHGATIGITLVLLWYAYRSRKVPFRLVSDRFAMGVCFAVIFIRIGNLFNSEIVGRTTDVAWGILFPQSVSARPDVDFGPVILTQARHPSQLYEALIGVVVFAIIYLVDRHYKKKGTRLTEGLTKNQDEKETTAKGKKKKGEEKAEERTWGPGKTKEQDRPLGVITFIFFTGYFGLRFFAEYFKEYQTDVVEQWTMGQWLSIPFTLVGVIGLWAIYFGPWKGQTATDYLKKASEPAGSDAESEPKTKKKSADKTAPPESSTEPSSQVSDDDDDSEKSGGGGPKRKLASNNRKKKKKR